MHSTDHAMTVNARAHSERDRHPRSCCSLGFLLLALATLPACRRAAPEPSVVHVTPSRDAAVVVTQDAAPTPVVARDFGRASMPVIDVHTHLDPTATSTILKLMDARNVRIAINLSGGFENSGLEESLEQSRQSNGRIIPFCTLPWRMARADDFVSNAVAVLESCHRLGIRGLKIPKVLGLGARDIDGSRLHVDAPRLDPIFETCGRLGMVVLIHSGDPKAFFDPPTPNNERYEELGAHPGWSFYGGDNPTFDAIITEFETRVLRHPNTTFIGAHFGNVAEDPARVESLLSRAPNYYIDTAARIPEFGRHRAEQMRAFFVRWQDRVLYGSDLGLGEDPSEWMLGSHGNEATTTADIERFFSSTWRYYETLETEIENPTPIQGRWKIHPVGLEPAVLKKIYGANAARLLHIPWPPAS